MILLIDNYDSFTYNLYQQIGALNDEITVARNDEITLEEIEKMSPQAMVISPGPGYPRDAGLSVEIIRRFSGRIPILGVCLGHQAIAEAFGGTIVRAKTLMHGKASEVTLNPSCPLFAGMPETMTAARYHSLIADREALPSCLESVSEDGEGQIMALRHRDHLTFGVQFHPESILTQGGNRLIYNFLRLAGIEAAEVSAPSLPPEKRQALKPYIFKVIDGESLTQEEAYAAMDCIMSGRATDSQIASFVTALRMKGETIGEITGFAKVMRDKAKAVPGASSAVDIVGTGGDMANTFNISTTSAFVIAGAGQKVAKHGNRSVSSKSGAADVLEALGAKITSTPELAKECLEETGVSFLFAQSFHGSMRFAATARKETGVRSVFNILGPLSNPARTDYIVLGVYDEALMEPMARVLMNLGIKGAMLVHGEDGLDEASICAVTRVCEIQGSKLLKYGLDPREYGFSLASREAVTGGTAQENAEITRQVLSGKEGAPLDIVLLNSACALYITGKASTLEEGVALARESIQSGRAKEKLEQYLAFTQAR